MLTTEKGPIRHGPKRGGINMLMPTAYDPEWTQLDDGVFNEYPWYGNGAIDGGFNNPNRSATIPIGPSTTTLQALLSNNPKRASLIMQNNSTAVSPDVAPTLYLNFGAQAQVGLCIGLAPGVGLVLDQNVQADSLYVVWGPYSNPGGTVVLQGAVLETSKQG